MLIMSTDAVLEQRLTQIFHLEHYTRIEAIKGMSIPSQILGEVVELFGLQRLANILFFNIVLFNE